MKTTYFGLDGNKLPTEKGAVCAISKNNADRESYKVAYITSGVEGGFMVNPQSVYFKPEVVTGWDKERSKPTIELREVAKETFDFYFKFLETKNVVYLRGAERSVA